MLRLRYQLIIFAGLLEFSREIENLSKRKNAWQPTNYVSESYTSHASSAVDGNRNQNFAAHSCALQLPSRYPTWRVDLGKPMRIDRIDIYFRYDSASFWNNTGKGRVAGFFLYISNTTSKEGGHVCFHRIHNETYPITPNVTIQCIQHGRYVIYYNERRPEVKYPSFYHSQLYNEICELEVYGCKNPGFYGNNCTNLCPPNCKNMYCDIGVGTCFSCNDGYQGEYCHQQCLNLSYGSQCAFPCGKCMDGETCNHVNGICPGSCAAGWQGAKCDKVCPAGTYGSNCTKNCSVNCFNKTNNWCNNESGKCTSGCRPGWQKDRCDKVCDNFYFGAQCEMQCGKCHDQKPCGNVNGLCPNGCSAGFQGEDCMTGCKDTFYGKDCKFNCSSECVNRTCNAITGFCFMSTQKSSGQETTDSGPLIGGVIGGLLIVSALAVVGVLFFRRFSRKNFTERDSKIKQKVIDDSTKNFSTLYENVSSEKKATSSAKYVVEIDTDIVEEDEITYENNQVKHKTFPGVPLSQLEQDINEKIRNDNEGFKQEYTSFPFGEQFSCSAGKMEENLKKNRFKTTFPYDHSRVRLQSSGTDKTDYINANYIDGIEREKRYIATQGPKQGTIKDFWRMIWQENVTQIVMLTNMKEGIKDKCAKYWPDIREHLVSGLYSITTTVEKEYAFFVLRKLNIKQNQTKKSRTVTHYHYTAWPDHGIPDTLCLVIFHQYVIRSEAERESSPIVVHCSAGIGRTGTYIAVDTLYKSGLKTNKVNIPEYVKTMRKDRMNMVQSCEQYIAIFLTLDEAFKVPVKVIPVAEFAAYFQNITKDIPANQNVLRKEVQTLLKMQQKYSDSDFKLAEQNSGLNSRTSILPLDRYSLHLMTSVLNRGTYINAITIPSYTKLKQFAIVPYPEKDSVVDLLRLLVDHNSKTIVLLDPIGSIKWSNLWIPKESMMSTVEPFTVTLKTSENKEKIETLVIDLLNKKDRNIAIQVSVLAPKLNISKGVDSDTGTIRELVTTLLNIDAEGLVTVMSRNGASMCGLFCAVFNVMQQMRLDDEVDIFTAVRQLQVRRPELCYSMDEYHACYKAIAEHILYTSDHVYNN